MKKYIVCYQVNNSEIPLIYGDYDSISEAIVATKNIESLIVKAFIYMHLQ